MYAVNASIPKTLVRHLVAFVSDDKRGGAAEALRRAGRYSGHPRLPGAAARRGRQDRPEDRGSGRPLRAARLLPLLRRCAGASRPKRCSGWRCTPWAGATSRDFILKWLKNFYRRFFTQQFKRSCLPDGPKVGTVTLCPRGDWRMPSDAVNTLWAGELEEL